LQEPHKKSISGEHAELLAQLESCTQYNAKSQWKKAVWK